MSANFENTTPIKVAEQAERDLNSDAAKKGHGGSDSSKLSIASTFRATFKLKLAIAPYTRRSTNPTPQQPIPASTSP